MKPKFFALTMLLAVLFSAFMPVSYASCGPVMSVDMYTNSQSLIYIKKPESRSSSTSDKTYTLSAAGTPGTVVSVYKYDRNANAYILEKDDVVIGSSGLYSMVVDLNDDLNNFRIFAQKGSDSQLVNIEINKIKQSTIDKLKGISVTIRDFFS